MRGRKRPDPAWVGATVEYDVWPSRRVSGVNCHDSTLTMRYHAVEAFRCEFAIHQPANDWRGQCVLDERHEGRHVVAHNYSGHVALAPDVTPGEFVPHPEPGTKAWTEIHTMRADATTPDIVRTLREWAGRIDSTRGRFVLMAAADEIERLRVEGDHLRATRRL